MTQPIFGSDNLNKMVEESLSNEIPIGHNNAIMGIVNSKGARIVAGFKLGENNNWQLTGIFEHEWTGSNTMEAKVMYSWE